jgi:type IV pilus assembly protein PilP
LKTTQMLKTVTVIAVFVAAPSWTSAQAAAKPVPAAATPAPAPATPPTPAPAAAATPATAPYSYDPGGRRDPFVSLVSRGVQAATPGRHAEGLGGLTTAEVILTGVLQSRGAFVALLRAPDGKTFNARVNDRLADGTIRGINPQGMVIMQEVNDPLSLVKVKEVRKGLRASDDVKQ